MVGIVVDQMRYDYLYRFYNRYNDEGFKRLLNKGFSYENIYITHLPTYTAVGHSTVYTGSVPAIHGITGNDWVDQLTGNTVYCVSDSTVESVGTTNANGKMSPKNLLVSTVGDELKLATNFRAKTISIAMKDRSSILPGGHFADQVYWFDGTTGNWITSSYYTSALPAWVNSYNEQKKAEQYLKEDWNTLYPIESYGQSIADVNSYEEAFKGAERTIFPVKTSELMKQNGMALLISTPMGNTFTLDFARRMIEQENLGNNISGITDFLSISLSSPDYIGHRFGINAVEVEDNYLRLDQDLGAFFGFLDQKIGKGQYTVFLTADHGAAHNPQFLIDRKGNAGYFESGKAMRRLNQHLKAKFNEEGLVISLANYQVHFNNRLIMEKSIDVKALTQEAVFFLRNMEGVSFVIEMDKANLSSVPALIRERVTNGYNYKRSGALQIILDPQLYSGAPKGKGTTHGSWYPYDSHIPLIWMGWGVKRGQSNERVSMTDIAPTIAAILHIQEPNGNIGNVLTQMLEHF